MIDFKEGDAVKHCGNPRTSKRVGWVGQVVCVRGHSMDVTWKYDQHGELLEYPKTQGYSEQWIGWYLRKCGMVNQETQNCNKNEENMNKFYIVVSEKFCEHSQYHPNVTHPTKQEAEMEAVRLSNRNGNKFFVLETVSCAIPPEKPTAKLVIL